MGRVGSKKKAASTAWWHRNGLVAGLLVGVAVTIRLAYTAGLAGTPFYEIPIIDAAQYYG